MIPGSANPLLLAGAAEAAGYEIERSLRFNSADSAYLSRTPSVSGDRKTWTWAGWVKRSGLGLGALFGIAAGGGTSEPFGFSSDDRLWFVQGATNYRISTSVYRDISAWYHIVLNLDTTQATANDRIKIYVNGQQVVSFNTLNNPVQNTDLPWNAAALHTIGSDYDGASTRFHFDGCLADIHFIEGQALDPTSFTEVDATTGQLVPIAYTGTYGTNGFHLPFSDNSTAAALGTDTSGAGNNWTVNNISVAAGAGNDSLVDTPTNYGTDTGAGGEVRGNYATWNPLNVVATTLTNGNLDSAATGGTTGNYCTSTIAVTTGKWYWEVLATTADSIKIGVIDTQYLDGGSGAYSNALSLAARVASGLWSVLDGGTLIYAGAAWANNHLVGIAYDADLKKAWFSVNGVWQGSGTQDPATNSGGYTSTKNLNTVVCTITTQTNNKTSAGSANFGQRPFAYTAPSGFKALCTQNLPSTTITTSGSYTGNGVADGPFVYLNGVPTAMTVDGNTVTFGTEADKLSNGFKIRTNSTTYNQNALTYNYSITSTGDPFKIARAQGNP